MKRISIHALRVEGDVFEYPEERQQAISIHALRVEGDGHLVCYGTHGQNFYPRPPGGGRPKPTCRHTKISYFYPRPPGGGRPGIQLVQQLLRQQFLSTPSGWRATLAFEHEFVHLIISIHALRVEGDRSGVRRNKKEFHFYPRPPGGGRLVPYYAVIRCGNFYPRPPGGGRHLYAQFFSMPPEISIHALRVEGDFSDWLVPFYYYISIHALRVEGDFV